MDEKKIYVNLFYLILISTLVRAFLAGFLELGNDEVYYWTYALYPDLSHFDHPPMVGFIIQAFTLNLIFENEFFLRLASILFGAMNTWLIYVITTRIKNSLAGFYAAVLFTASIYCFIIAGTFILPDTPQLLFWLLSLYFLTTSVTYKVANRFTKTNLLLAGLTLGLGMLSKYTTVFLWFGTIAFILLYNRRWLKTKELYISMLISLFIFIPVIVWNFQNDFISFSFQSERVNMSESGIKPDYFFQELGGQILYNNPINFVLIMIALVALIAGRNFIPSKYKRFLLWNSLPLILLFLVFALFRRTLPHWTGPGYLGLIIIAATYFASRLEKKGSLFPWPLQLPLYLLLIILFVGTAQIKGGWFLPPKVSEDIELGKDDVTLDMYGWDQLRKKFEPIYESDLKEGRMDSNAVMISFRWFPAANLDYYVARPLKIRMLAIGELERIHKYAWINRIRGGFRQGMDAYFLTSSRDFKDPEDLYHDYFTEIIPADTIAIERGGEVVKYVFVYHLKGLKKEVPDSLAIE
ncbi:MAG: glycosyltransferase family 39 protein [Bacteroidales bacterium]|nr:glycosyltransferase family 39 protein [Bacteroidales bacterium]MCF8386737.1 glycosyltransferase family 39 protein [Bacteroidales bacterium]MCF8397259.1 glycosyltransferase family 39 protein [Bacteroidales bacterium]